MDKALIVFEFEGTEISSFVDDLGRDWFRGTDVCKALSISNPSVVINRVASEYSQEIQLGKGRPALYVSEPGLYALIFSSKSPKAKKFQRWVFEEVLPSIRKTGTYKSPNMTFDQHLESLVADIRAIASSPELSRNVGQAQSEELKLLRQGKLMSAEERGRILAQGLTPLQLKQLRLHRLLPELEQIASIGSEEEENQES